MVDYYTKAFLIDTEKSVVTDDSKSTDSDMDEQSLQTAGELRFGEKALIIKDDFKTVTSDLSDELGFTLNGDPMHRGKVRSIIAPIKTYKPKKMEIWVFREYATIMPHSIMNTTLDGADDEDGDYPRASDVDEDMSRPGDTDSDNKSSPFISKLAGQHGGLHHSNTMGDSMPLRGKRGSAITQQQPRASYVGANPMAKAGAAGQKLPIAGSRPSMMSAGFRSKFGAGGSESVSGATSKQTSNKQTPEASQKSQNTASAQGMYQNQNDRARSVSKSNSPLLPPMAKNNSRGGRGGRGGR